MIRAGRLPASFFGGCVMRKTRVAARLVGRVVVCGVAATLLAGMLAACDVFGGGTSTGGIPSVTIGAKDFSFDMPDTAPTGLVSLTINNTGKQPHQANIARLNDGVTRQQVEEALKNNPDSALPLLTFVGGPNTIDPGKSQTVVVDMPPGNYVALCFVPDPSKEGKPHLADGMVKFFTVNQGSGEKLAEPKDDGLVTLRDFAFEMPGTPRVGTVTWKVWNHGTQPHELTLIKLAQGKTMQDVEMFMQRPTGQPPYSNEGGIGALAPEHSGWATLNLGAGDYVALCFVPDPSTGKAHYTMGMLTPFTVQ